MTTQKTPQKTVSPLASQTATWAGWKLSFVVSLTGDGVSLTASLRRARKRVV